MYGYGSGNPFGELSSVIGSVVLLVIIYIVFILALVAFMITTYVMGSIALKKMAEQRNMSNSWMGWVPIVRKYLTGAIVDDIKSRTRKKTYFRFILLAGSISTTIASIVVFVTLQNIFSDPWEAFELIGTLRVWCYLWGIFAFVQRIVELTAHYSIFRDYSKSPGVLVMMSIFQSAATPFIFYSYSSLTPASMGSNIDTHKGSANNDYSHSNIQNVTTKGNISGISGMYAGQSFQIGNGENLVFGRDCAFAHIIIDNNAEKVSRKHCSIKYEAHRHTYSVTDFSSNGTFYNGNARLVTNIPTPLPAGTVLALGDNGNQFRLG